MGMCPTDWLRNMLRQTNREGFCTQSMPCPVAFLQRPHTLPSLYVIICMYPQLIFSKKFTIIAREPASHAKIRVAKELCTLKINKGEILQVIPSPEIGSEFGCPYLALITADQRHASTYMRALRYNKGHHEN